MSENLEKNILPFDIILNEAIVVENFHSNFGMANNKIFKNFGNSRKVIKLVPTRLGTRVIIIIIRGRLAPHSRRGRYQSECR
jgi:putative transposon-encoded protein